MASFRKTLHLDAINVKTIFVRGQSNSNIPAFNVLTSDGAGGTMWMTLSSFKYGGAFHKIITTGATYTADISGAVLSILDGPNAGLINDSTAPNTAYLYAKAFGQINISSGNSLLAYNSTTNRINSNVSFVGTGGITIRGDPQQNVVYFDGRELPFISTMPYSFSKVNVFSNVPPCTLIASTSQSIIIQANGPSSLLSFVGVDPIKLVTNYQTNQIQFTVPNLTNSDISSIKGGLNVSSFNVFTISSLFVSSINYGQGGGSGDTTSSTSTLVTYINQMTSTINSDLSTFSTLTVFGGSTPSTLSTFVTYINQMNSTINSELSTFSTLTYVPELHLSSIRTSSITVSGLRQPFIQYGTISITSAGPYTITLPISYINTSYVVQVTFNGSTATNTAYVINTTVGNFTVTTSATGVSLNWTAFGNIF